LVGVGVIAAAAAAVSAIRAQVAGLVAWKREQIDRLEAILAVVGGVHA
jgi:hypothetical protein